MSRTTDKQLIERIIKNSDKDSRVHTDFHQDVAKTFRISTSKPTVQNINKADEFRKLFVADKEKILIGADYSQFQLRIIAHLALVNNFKSGLQEAFEKDLDLHSWVAKVLIIDRQLAKNLNFAACYGMSVQNFKNVMRQGSTLKLTEEGWNNVANSVFNQWHNQFPEIKSLYNFYLHQILSKGYVSSPFGQRVLFDLEGMSEFEMNKEGWSAFNSVVQMYESSIIKLAIKEICGKIKEYRLQSKLLLTVHDELLFQSSKKDCSDMIDLIVDCMKNCYTMKVPLKVNIKAGWDWSEVH